MKLIKVILTGVFLVSLVSCKQAVLEIEKDTKFTENAIHLYDEFNDEVFRARYRTQIFYDDYSAISDPSLISSWINDRIHYASDPYGTDRVDPLSLVMAKGYCDCEEFALLYLNILYVRFGIKGTFCVCDYGSARSIVEGGYIDHAAIKVDGVLIEPQSGDTSNYKVGFEYSFDEIFYR